MEPSEQSELKKRLLKDKSDFIPIQQVQVPNKKEIPKGEMDYPEAIPIVGERKTDYGGKFISTRTPFDKNVQNAEGRRTNLNALHLQMVKNTSKIFQLDLQLKAMERQIESYKYANNPLYYEETEKKMKILREYQVIVTEQNLIQQEIEYQKKQEIEERKLKEEEEKKKKTMGKEGNMIDNEKRKPKLVARGIESFQVEKEKNYIVNPSVNTRYQSRGDRDACADCCKNCDGEDVGNCLLLGCYCFLKIMEAAG